VTPILGVDCDVFCLEGTYHFAISLFVAWVASTCLHRPISMFWSHSMSIVIEVTTFVTLEERRQGVVLLNSLSFTAFRVVQGSSLHLPSVL
jgi:hypothetical protein